MPDSLLRHETATAAQLTAHLGISQPTLSRRLRARKDILAFGKGKSTRYALLRPVNGLTQFPLYRINEQGQAAHWATLYPIWPQESCVVYDMARSAWQHYEGLPWYLYDMRPQGFLGRAWGRHCAASLALPDDIARWSDTQVLIALANGIEDTPGDKVLGEASYQRWLTRQLPEPVLRADKRVRYRELAERALAGDPVGSSAGGEQPKFTCWAETGAGLRHVLVKFTPAQHNENSARWADLLQAEHLALEVLRQFGLSAAESCLLHGDNGQTFLEMVRFDRAGAEGRRGVASLLAVDAEFIGQANLNWARAAQSLAQGGYITAETRHHIEVLYAFGRLIANSDMHQGNFSFLHPDTFPLVPAPVYDMLPMAFAPSRQGDMRHAAPDITLTAEVSRQVWQQAQEMAQVYWQRLSESPGVSERFRQLAGDMLRQTEKWEAQIFRMA
ncbi:transcriptional regulator [Chimaeribacter californicus]|uniref:Transcriptional regulator n=1 Tax=Chimaeribacter californicus TaxID=2060067 RepID=A0A2N5EF19_9GAMM|nr:type II toxin-antitoxin system HipA family toxin YjjJ [Chimaeribacter californicus]PLR41125.1 transcriptional regulator [Chimaeribacter californicus]